MVGFVLSLTRHTTCPQVSQSKRQKKKSERLCITNETRKFHRPQISFTMMDESVDTQVRLASISNDGGGDPNIDENIPNSSKCHVCGIEALTRRALNAHLRKVHAITKPYACAVCSHRTTALGSLRRHMARHDKVKQFKCNICEFRTAHEIALKNHKRTHNENKVHKCSMCNYQTHQKGNLVRHTSFRHNSEKKFKCSMCDYQASTKEGLGSHMLTHTDFKKYACEICDYRCTKKILLTYYMATHTGEKNHACSE